MKPTARLTLLAACIAVATPAAAQWSGQDVAPPTRVDWRLVAGPMEGPRTRLVALVAVPKAGWHTYWTPKGEPNVPTKVTWRVDGAKVGAGRWPVPKRFEASGLANYGYDRRHAIVFPVTLSGDASSGRAISAALDYYVCSDSVCAAEKADVTGAIGADVPFDAAEWRTFREAIPHRSIPDAIWWTRDGRSGLSFRVPDGANGAIAFLPYLEGAFLRAGVQTVTVADGVATVRGEKGSGEIASGIVTIGGRGWKVEPRRIDPPAAAEPAPATDRAVAGVGHVEAAPIAVSAPTGAGRIDRTAASEAESLPAHGDAKRIPLWIATLAGLLLAGAVAAGLLRRYRTV